MSQDSKLPLVGEVGESDRKIAHSKWATHPTREALLYSVTLVRKAVRCAVGDGRHFLLSTIKRFGGT